jgi:hypothetical protein
MDVLKLFRPADDKSPETKTLSLDEDELREEIRAQAEAVLRKGGVNLSCVEAEIRLMGHAKDKPLFWCLLRLVRWERSSGLRLLLGLPHIERALRRQLAGSWVAEASLFGGIWMHPSTKLLESEGMKELAAVLAGLNTAGSAPLSDAMWSSQPSLD